MRRALGVGLVLTVGGAGATVLGLVVLFLYSLSEVLANPGTSFVDGYEIGRLPWTAIGIDLVVTGSTVAVVFGTAWSWLAGGAARRLISLVPLAGAATWWFLAAIESSFEGAPCAPCAQPGFDPFSVAYSAPSQAVLLLILPAATSALIALSSRSRRRLAAPAG
jgi:hypothetical protein